MDGGGSNTCALGVCELCSCWTKWVWETDLYVDAVVRKRHAVKLADTTGKQD